MAPTGMAPSMTNPAAPNRSAWARMISPIRAWLISPPPSTTITSPGGAIRSAAWIARLSPLRVLTVRAVPMSNRQRDRESIQPHRECAQGCR